MEIKLLVRTIGLWKEEQQTTRVNVTNGAANSLLFAKDRHFVAIQDPNKMLHSRLDDDAVTGKTRHLPHSETIYSGLAGAKKGISV